MPRQILLFAALAIALTSAACANNALNSAPVETNQVRMPKSYKFAPAVIRVQAGATVTWKNDDNFTHSVFVKDSGKAPLNAPPGESVQITFDKPGEYLYTCTFHPNDMNGKVIVLVDSSGY